MMLLLLACCISARASIIQRVAASPIARGAVLRVASDLTGGLPLEQWKTRVTRFPNETATTSLRSVYRYQGGVKAFWAGTGARVVEGSCSGAVLLAARGSAASVLRRTAPALADTALAAFATGAAAGCCQALVMGPCTYLVTRSAVEGKSALRCLRDAFADKDLLRGLATLYAGAGAVAARQATNWASRQGLTDLFQRRLGLAKYGAAGALACGVLGGIGSCWNTPLEVKRIRTQSDMGTLGDVYREEGFAGCFRGVTPRAAQAAWQTCFMVVVPQLMFS